MTWAQRGGLTAPLTAPKRRYGHIEPLDSEIPLRLVRRLLHDENLDLRDRVGGCLVLL